MAAISPVVQVTGPRETQNEIVRTTRWLRALCAACYGPYGQNMVVRNQAAHGHMTVTSSAARLFRHIQFPATDVAAQLVKEMVMDLTHSFGDCGHFSVLLCCNLLLSTLSNSDHAVGIFDHPFASIPRRIVIAGNELAVRWTSEYLHSPDCPLNAAVSWDEPESIRALLATVLLSKNVCQLDSETADENGALEHVRSAAVRTPPSPEAHALAHLVFQAFLNSLAIDEMSQTLKPNIHVVSADSTAMALAFDFTGPDEEAAATPVCAHELLCNSVLLDIPLTPDTETAIAEQQRRQRSNSRDGGDGSD